MASISAEYQRFLVALARMPVPENVRRMANLVFNNLEALAEVGTARRARSVRLASMAVADLLTTSAQINEEDSPDQDYQYDGRLHELTVGPFRGFMSEEVFDLSREITLVYGANGTGKSSFCEALESAMLGSINEARAKRVDHYAYCNNLRIGRHVSPVVTLQVDQDVPVQLGPNEEAYRFCFIEKNRLDDFARIAARTPGDQRHLIATLFGVDQFSEFVRGFNSTLDENLNIRGEKASALEQHRVQLAAYQKIIRDNPERLEKLAQDEANLANRFFPGRSFSEVCDWVFGNDGQQGQLSYVQGLLDAPPPQVYEVSKENLTALLAECYRIDGVWQEIRKQLAARAGDVSFTQLYEAVLQLSENAETCPACKTDLRNVAENPFDRAQAGLQELEELSAMQKRERLHQQELERELQKLLTAMSSCVQAVNAVCPDEFNAVNLPALPDIATGHWLQGWMDNDKQAWDILLSLVARVEAHNAESHKILNQRADLTEERNRLQELRTVIERCGSIRSTGDLAFAAAQKEVEQFDEANRQLIDEVAVEAEQVTHHLEIKASYDGFLVALKQYLEALPALLLRGLGQRACDLYNAFNRDDPPADLLHALTLPVAENNKITIEFAGEPGVPRDALVILSEGHIKCLGLAILLAKNIEQGCPFVIFDDVVNAIDDDHRNGILRTLFEDDLLEGKQIILTSHAEEFLHRIQQELGRERLPNLKVYKFLPHEGEHHLRIDTDPPTKNYVSLANIALDGDEKRDALRHSRPAIESLTDRLWRWMERQGHGSLELKLGGPRAKWELHNKCVKLRRVLERVQNPPPAIPAILTALDELLGIDGASIEWGYLNSGTHDSERLHEFDRAVVRKVVEAVTALDAGLTELQRGR